MNEIKRFGAFTSSVDPAKLSKTVEGLIIGASTLIIFIASHLGISLGGDQVSTAAVDIGTIAATLVTLFGLLRKVVVSLSTPAQS